MTTPPAFDSAALDGYADRLAACRRHNLEPVVTLQHFTHPAWLGVDVWLDDRTPALFEQFVSTAVAHVNRRLVEIHGERPLQWFVTINEPNMLVINTYLNRHFPGGGQRGMKVAVTAYNRLLAAHVRAYNAIHDLFESEGWGTPRVTMNTFCSDVYWSEKMLLDLLCLRERGVRTPELKAYLQAGSNRPSSSFAQGRPPLPFRPVCLARASLSHSGQRPRAQARRLGHL